MQVKILDLDHLNEDYPHEFISWSEHFCGS